MRAETRSIPSLDGLRAISVLFVLGVHTLQRMEGPRPIPEYWYAVFNGALGVRIFFVLSGYLITRLLLREREKTGQIRLGRFYVRRAFRILPPLYLYLLFLAVLGWMGRMQVAPHQLLDVAFFYHDYDWAGSGLWAVEHTWTLCIEEQFYLLWPALLLWCLSRRPGERGRVLAAKVCVGVIAVEPLVRIASNLLGHRLHSLALEQAGNFHMQADTLMFGCLAALTEGHARFERVYRAVTRVWWLPFVLAFVVVNALEIRYQNYWNYPIGFTLSGFLIVMVMVWTVRNPESVVGRVLNQPVVAWVGTLSYSIYIWQTFFLNQASVDVIGRTPLNTLPTSWLAILAVAVFSFYCVERPARWLRDRVLQRRVSG